LVFGEKTRVFKDVHFVSYSTVEGVAKKMVVFVADSLTIESNVGAKTFENVCVGVTFKKFNDAINFEMLLHPSLMGI
ncbi:MAG: sigma-E processing peptidase SpoIIGA, partial [Clostridia bacterium]|nr:sigma-E processing peptidase SpoIIGA [Clostridia bacterium]